MRKKKKKKKEKEEIHPFHRLERFYSSWDLGVSFLTTCETYFCFNLDVFFVFYRYGEEWERIAENNRSELMQDGRENSWFSHIPVFSRDQESKVYVTHSIKNNHKLVENMLCHSDDIIDHEVGEKEEMGVGSERKRALLFVAGNASNTMVKDVKAEIDKIGYSSSPSSSSSQTNSVGLVSHLKKEKRMFIEAW